MTSKKFFIAARVLKWTAIIIVAYCTLMYLAFHARGKLIRKKLYSLEAKDRTMAILNESLITKPRKGMAKSKVIALYGKPDFFRMENSAWIWFSGENKPRVEIDINQAHRDEYDFMLLRFNDNVLEHDNFLYPLQDIYMNQ